MDGRPAATETTLLGAVELRVENRRRIGARRLFLKVKVGADIEHLEQGWPPVPERLVILFVKIPIDEAVTLLAEYIGHLHGRPAHCGLRSLRERGSWAGLVVMI